MRGTARRLLADDAEPPMPDELETLTLQLRGHLMLAVPEVETAAGRLPEDDIPRACALACVGEARMRLNLEPGRSLPVGISHAQQLARSVNALCDHYENLGGPHPAGPEETPGQAAYRRMLVHGSACPTCRSVNEDGSNADVSCETGDRLYEEYRQARRGPAASH
ncbi:DUF6415 family natural product biosynthesis protein [Streptomyces sp. NPDC059866]|uniref:DUF6415 family natural product biosynthesis protein n=1 Tax=Streptomyces sp. NPDC059866 TaxID=3346978 RepID=UPI0036568391